MQGGSPRSPSNKGVEDKMFKSQRQYDRHIYEQLAKTLPKDPTKKDRKDIFLIFYRGKLQGKAKKRKAAEIQEMRNFDVLIKPFLEDDDDKGGSRVSSSLGSRKCSKTHSPRILLPIPRLVSIRGYNRVLSRRNVTHKTSDYFNTGNYYCGSGSGHAGPVGRDFYKVEEEAVEEITPQHAEIVKYCEVKATLGEDPIQNFMPYYPGPKQNTRAKIACTPKHYESVSAAVKIGKARKKAARRKTAKSKADRSASNNQKLRRYLKATRWFRALASKKRRQGDKVMRWVHKNSQHEGTIELLCATIRMDQAIADNHNPSQNEAGNLNKKTAEAVSKARHPSILHGAAWNHPKITHERVEHGNASDIPNARTLVVDLPCSGAPQARQWTTQGRDPEATMGNKEATEEGDSSISSSTSIQHNKRRANDYGLEGNQPVGDPRRRAPSVIRHVTITSTTQMSQTTTVDKTTTTTTTEAAGAKCCTLVSVGQGQTITDEARVTLGCPDPDADMPAISNDNGNNPENNPTETMTHHDYNPAPTLREGDLH